jgi:hypothetical protein
VFGSRCRWQLTFCPQPNASEEVVDVALLEHSVRENLNLRTPRVMVVLDPL